ncbi:MAG: BtrH N-terminal domain-containing protein [Deltaproteobacteria bacterium]|nr:BtrH N-terminal domain-containing protein [Deltaproteobacteria bacterium]MCL5278186.1 BtrH N-terminal domain-containing protein [Deltaproteobacteria bacterium]
MGQTIVKNWVHVPGRHCASTALADLMRFYGYGLTEPECFCIGAGLGFWYIEGLNPSRILHFRSRDIEEVFFRNIGVDFTWAETDSRDDIRTALLSSIDGGMPVLLRTDIFYLDYYKSKTHFPGHVVVLWGYDLEDNTAYVSDTERKGLTQCSLDALLEGVLHGNFPEGTHAHFTPVARPDLVLQRKKLLAAGAKENAKSMLSHDAFEGYGVGGMRLASRKIVEWKALDDWRWLARFAYQVMEKRGTGGGGFRKMYAEALEGFLGRKLVSAMRQIAARWTDISAVLKEISEATSPDFGMVADMLFIQAIKEEEFYKDVLDY